MSKSDRLEFFSSVAPMIAAGIPLIEAVQSAGERTKPNIRAVANELVRRLSSGDTLSASMSACPQAFDPVSVSLVKSAEDAGVLEDTLNDLTIATQREIQFDENIRSALLYPVFIFGVFCIVLVVMLLFVVPRVATVFERLRFPVPVSTQILISVSLFLQSFYPLVALVIVLVIIGAYSVVRRNPKWLSTIFSSLPLLSTLAIELDLSRFSHTMGLLLSAGMPFPESIKLASLALYTEKARTAIAFSHRMLESGKTFSQGLDQKKSSLPPLFFRMIQSGEQSGSLQKSFENAGSYFEKRVESTLKSVTILLEPIMIVTIGFFVGGMMLAIVAPIYGLISNIAGGQ